MTQLNGVVSMYFALATIMFMIRAAWAILPGGFFEHFIGCGLVLMREKKQCHMLALLGTRELGWAGLGWDAMRCSWWWARL